MSASFLTPRGHFRVLPISLVANVGLTMALLWRCFVPGESSRSTAVAPLPAQKTVLAAAPSVAATPTPAPSTAPFNWRQLESPDFPTFIVRLRAIGCPETTLRDIVKGELDEIYAERRRQADGRGTTLARLAQEEEIALSQLLGGPSTGAQAPPSENAEPQLGPRGRRRSVTSGPPVMPLAFQDVDPTDSTMTNSQRTALDQLKQSFLEEVGGGNPSDPEYMAKWQTAQPLLDQQLQTLLGADWALKLQSQRGH